MHVGNLGHLQFNNSADNPWKKELPTVCRGWLLLVKGMSFESQTASFTEWSLLNVVSDLWNAELVATDKVALIISNCNYKNLPSLLTPHCDAEMLAGSLQNLGLVHQEIKH